MTQIIASDRASFVSIQNCWFNAEHSSEQIDIKMIFLLLREKTIFKSNSELFSLPIALNVCHFAPIHESFCLDGSKKPSSI